MQEVKETQVPQLYQIGGDKRILQSRSCIYSAMRILLNEKPFHKISVSELTKKAGVGRATFYRNFTELEDVLRQHCKDLFKLYRIYKSEHCTISSYEEKEEGEGLIEFFDFWKTHYDMIEILVISGRQQILNDFMESLSQEDLREMMEIKGMSDVDRTYFLTIIRSMLVGVLLQWISRDRIESSEELSGHLLRPFRMFRDKYSVQGN